MSVSFWPWAIAASAYLLFLAWYQNWRGPLSKAEIERYLPLILAANPHSDDRNDTGVLKAFLENDDGREFYMLNLVRVADGTVADPKTGAQRPARKVMEDYTKAFLPALFRRGGHPAIAARKVGGYFDAWGVEADPGWTIMGYMRYRSRRDVAKLVSNPKFGGAHDFKFAAMPQTFSFPTQPVIMGLASPRWTAGLGLALAASLAQSTILLLQTL